MTGAPAPGSAAGRLQQTVAAATILAVACWIAFVSFDVEDPQPYLFPQLFSGIMAVLGLIVVFRAARGLDRTAAGIAGRTFRNIAPGLAVMLIYVFGLAEWLGFYAAAFLAMFVLYSLYDPNPHRSLRSWAVRLAVTCGFIAVIINRPGAGGRTGWNHFASKASTDGYQLAAYNVPHFIAQSIKFKVKYNIDNLEPIANWGADPAVLVVNKDSEFNSVKDLAAWAKDNPGKVTVSGAGLFVGHHIAFLQIQKALGATLRYVPHKGGAPALKSVLGGQVMAGVNNLSDSYRSRANLKILGIADLQRDKQFLPDVPTFKEQGYDVDDSSVNFRGIMVRKGTPEAVIDKLAKIVPAMFANGRVAKQMRIGGSPIRIMDRAAVKKMWAERQTFLTGLLQGLK